MKILSVIVLLFSSIASQAKLDAMDRNTRAGTCEQKYDRYLKDKDASYNYGEAAKECRLACQRSTLGFDDRALAAKYEDCSNGVTTGSAGVRCDANNAKLSDGTNYGSDVWDACALDCAQAVNETSISDLKKKYATILNSCKQKATSGEPVNPNGDMLDEGATDTVAEDDATSGDDDSGGLEPADTGDPNKQALQSLLGSGLNNSNSRTPIDGGAVDFTGGGRGGGGSYADAAGGSGSVGFGGSNNVPAVVIDDTPGEMKAAGNPGAGGPAAGTGSPGGGGAGGMGGGGGGGSPSRPGGGGGGPRTSIAGAQLGKVGQNVFWSGNGGGATGSSGSSRKTATASPVDKKTMGPSYLNKGTGDAGLLRLFGASTPKIGSGQSQSCADNTVFCSHENYFIRVDRYPNSDINPNSGTK